jgi:hypothetical protein
MSRKFGNFQNNLRGLENLGPKKFRKFRNLDIMVPIG